MSAFLAPWRGRLLAAGLVILMAAVTAANYRFAVQAPGGSSFLSGWMAIRAWVVEGRSPYAASVGEAAQALLYGRPASPSNGEDPLSFSLPLPAVALYLPFAPAPYPLARALWMTVLEVCLPGLALLGSQLARWRAPPRVLIAVLVFSTLWYHGVLAIVSGDLAPVEGLLIAGWLWAFIRKRDVLGGILLAAATVRPEVVFLLLPLAGASAVRTRRWAFVASLVVTLAVLIAVSLALQPGWPLPWLWRLLEVQQAVGLDSAVSLVVGGSGRFATIARWVVSALLAGYATWEWIRAQRLGERGPVWAAQVVLVLSLWIAPQRSTAVFVVLIPGLVLLWGALAGRRSRTSGWVIAGTLFLVGGGSWGLYLATAAQAAESPLLLFPVPLLTLLGLWWIRSWTTRSPVLRLESD